jgi:hypothetical protein
LTETLQLLLDLTSNLIRSTTSTVVFIVLFLYTAIYFKGPVSEISNVDQKTMGAYAIQSKNTSSLGTLNIVLISNNGSFIAGGQFLIKPNPFSRNEPSLLVQDDSGNDTERVSKGIISLTKVQKGNYTVTQTRSLLQGSMDKLSKIVDVKSDAVATATFIDRVRDRLTTVSSSEIDTITYSAKFVCGSIIGNEGPLRPGHYDTDISIYNKQTYPLKILWNAVVNNGSTTNSIIKTLQPESAIGISCNDIRYLLDVANNSNSLSEGFLAVKLPLSGSLLGTISPNSVGNEIAQSINNNNSQLDLLDVQAFYTANSLERIAHEIIIDKITFTILNDPSGKIPRSLLQKQLEISIPSELNTIYDQISRVRNFMAGRFGLSNLESNNIDLRIERTSLGIENNIDDHAISIFSVRPQGSNNS